MGRPNWFRLFENFMRWGASRTFCTAGKSKPTKTAMMAMTTSSSINVNALPDQEQRLDEKCGMTLTPRTAASVDCISWDRACKQKQRDTLMPEFHVQLNSWDRLPGCLQDLERGTQEIGNQNMIRHLIIGGGPA